MNGLAARFRFRDGKRWRVLPSTLAALILLLPGVPALGTTIALKSGCALTQAINGANGDIQVGTCATGSGADTIVLDADINVTDVDNTAPDLGANGLPIITTDITIKGDGFTIRRASTDLFRLFYVATGGSLTLRRVVVEEGEHIAAGCIYVADDGFLALDRSVVRDCTAYRGGGIYTGAGTLRIEESFLAGNTAKGPSGESTYGAAMSTFGADLTVLGSTFYGNVVLDASGETSPDGGAMRIVGGSATIRNSTFSTNLAAGNGGAVAVQHLWFIPPSPTVLIAHSTFYSNVAGGTGSAISHTGGEVTLTANIMTGGPLACDGSFLDGGDNLGCLGGPAVTGLDATLQDNGGPTPTHALVAGSNAIENAIPCHADLDQRRFVRDENCDSGAYEFSECEDIQLEDDTILGPRVFEADCSLSVGPNWAVGPGGNATLRAGRRVVLNEGFGVEIVGRLTVEIDPALLVP